MVLLQTCMRAVDRQERLKKIPLLRTEIEGFRSFTAQRWPSKEELENNFGMEKNLNGIAKR